MDSPGRYLLATHVVITLIGVLFVLFTGLICTFGSLNTFVPHSVFGTFYGTALATGMSWNAWLIADNFNLNKSGKEKGLDFAYFGAALFSIWSILTQIIYLSQSYRDDGTPERSTDALFNGGGYPMTFGSSVTVFAIRDSDGGDLNSSVYDIKYGSAIVGVVISSLLLLVNGYLFVMYGNFEMSRGFIGKGLGAFPGVDTAAKLFGSAGMLAIICNAIIGWGNLQHGVTAFALYTDAHILAALVFAASFSIELPEKVDEKNDFCKMEGEPDIDFLIRKKKNSIRTYMIFNFGVAAVTFVVELTNIITTALAYGGLKINDVGTGLPMYSNDPLSDWTVLFNNNITYSPAYRGAVDITYSVTDSEVTTVATAMSNFSTQQNVLDLVIFIFVLVLFGLHSYMLFTISRVQGLTTEETCELKKAEYKEEHQEEEEGEEFVLKNEEPPTGASIAPARRRFDPLV